MGIRKIFSIIILCISSSIFLSSCDVKEVEVGEIQSFNILKIDKEYVTVDIAANMRNPNTFSFTISQVDLDVTFNGVYLGKINKVKDVRIPKNSDELQHLEFKLKMENIVKGSMVFLPALLSNKAKIKIKGFVKASKFPFGKKIEVDYDKTTKFTKD